MARTDNKRKAEDVTLQSLLERVIKIEEQTNEIPGLKFRVEELENENRELRHKCSTLEKNARAQYIDKDFKYPAEAVLTEGYFQNLGYQPGANPVSDIIDTVTSLRTEEKYDEFDQVKHICVGCSDDPILLEEDKRMKPHWEEWGKAMRFLYPIGGKGIKCRSLCICNVLLTRAQLELLPSALENKAIDLICLENNGCNPVLIAEMLVKVCRRNPFLKSIDYTNKFKDIDVAHSAMETLTAIFRDFRRNNSIEAVAVTDSCPTPDVGDCVGQWLLENAGTDGGSGYPPARFVKVDLSSNHITGKSTISSDHYLHDIISRDYYNGLEDLNLNGNMLDDTDACLIAKALKKNTKLKRLLLKNNKIKETGKSALKDCISSTESFQALYNCNHTCTIYLGEDDEDILKNASRDEKMKAAILSSCSEGNLVRDLDAEFDDQGMGSPRLVPETIRAVVRRAWPRGDEGRKQARKSRLSATYDLMKGFVVPKLCGLHGIEM